MSFSSSNTILTALENKQEFKPLPLGEIYFKKSTETGEDSFVHLNKEQTELQLNLKDKFTWMSEPEVAFGATSLTNLLRVTNKENILRWKPNQISATIGLFFTPEVGFSTLALKPIKEGEIIGLFSGKATYLPHDISLSAWDKKHDTVYSVYIAPLPGEICCVDARHQGGILRFMPNLPHTSQLEGTPFESKIHEYATANTVTAEMESKDGPLCFIVASKDIEPGNPVGFPYQIKPGFYLFSKTGVQSETLVHYDRKGKVREPSSVCKSCTIL